MHSCEGRSLEEQIVERMSALGLTLTTVESCTGGMAASRIVNVSGASEVLMQGIVTYSNEAKTRLVGVREETLRAHGAVSPETAREMAEGGVRFGRTDLALATTGIAGPGGGTPEKPVGLVYIAVSDGTRTEVRKLNLAGDRLAVRTQAAEAVFGLLWDTFLTEEQTVR